MKIISTIFLGHLLTAQAFAPCNSGRSLAFTSLKVERGDSAEAVESALEASRKFGATSKEAMVAWDIVEEIRASDNSAAYVNSENDALSDPTKNKEYYEKFLELKKLGELQRDHIDSIKHVTNTIRAIKLSPPESSSESTVGPHDEVLAHALSEARLMTENHGIASSEAKLAWEVVEHIASDDMTEAMKGSIGEEDCLIEMIEACEAMDELNRALFLDSKKEAGRYQG